MHETTEKSTVSIFDSNSNGSLDMNYCPGIFVQSQTDRQAESDAYEPTVQLHRQAQSVHRVPISKGGQNGQGFEKVCASNGQSLLRWCLPKTQAKSIYPCFPRVCKSFLNSRDVNYREVYNCHLCCFSDICIPLKNEIAWLYGRPHLNYSIHLLNIAFQTIKICKES